MGKAIESLGDCRWEKEMDGTEESQSLDSCQTPS